MPLSITTRHPQFSLCFLLLSIFPYKPKIQAFPEFCNTSKYCNWIYRRQVPSQTSMRLKFPLIGVSPIIQSVNTSMQPGRVCRGIELMNTDRGCVLSSVVAKLLRVFHKVDVRQQILRLYTYTEYNFIAQFIFFLYVKCFSFNRVMPIQFLL